MHRRLPMLLLLLAGCTPVVPFPAETSVAVAAGVPVPGRAITPATVLATPYPGMPYNPGAAGSCLGVRVAQTEARSPVVLPPPCQPFCTRTLGNVNCWADPAALPGRPTGVADGGDSITPAQAHYQTRGWQLQSFPEMN